MESIEFLVQDKNSSTSSYELLSYQPICDATQRTMGMEVISHHDLSSLSSDRHIKDASQNVSAIFNCLMYTGLSDLLRGRKVFIKVTHDFLYTPLVQLLPKDSVVLSLAPCAHLPADLPQIASELMDAGYILALNQWAPDDIRSPLLPYTRIININFTGSQDMAEECQKLLPKNIPILASNIRTRKQFEQAKTMGAKLFQGDFYLAPFDHAPGSGSATTQTILDLIAELNSDGPDSRLVNFFKENPVLSLQLLELVNSAMTGFNISINSINQAIFVLGRTQMIRWLQVMLYTAEQNAICPSLLMRAALWRARFMELLGLVFQHKVKSKLEDMAFITGLLSLSEVLIGEPLAEIVEKIKLSQHIEAALLRREGVLGGMLSLAEALEKADFDTAQHEMDKLHFHTDIVIASQNNALSWVNGISCR